MTETPSGYRQLADYFGCHVDTVRLAFSLEVMPEQMSKTWLDEQGLLARKYELAIAATSKLIDRLNALGKPETNLLKHQYGCPSVLELVAMRSAMEEQMSALSEWAGSEERRGGRDPAAGTVARGVARLFHLMSLPITFGHTEGEPTTKFGRDVEFAFAAFSIESNWRQYASEAYADRDAHAAEAMALLQAEKEK